MIRDLIFRQMTATKAAAEALIQSIEMFEAIVEKEAKLTEKAPTPPPLTPAPPPDPAPGKDGACLHPREYRLPTPTMGHLHRALCGVCGESVETMSDEQPGSKEEG